MSFMTKNLLVRLKLFGLLLSLIVAYSCGKKPKLSAGGSENVEQEVKYHPSLAKVNLKTQPATVPADQMSELGVPGFSFEYLESDMVRILRCNKSYDLRHPTTAESIKEMRSNQSYLGPDILKWSWQEALQSKECRLLGAKITRQEFRDLSAKSGQYYYVINPCVSQPLSLTNLEDCSYDLAFTDSVDYRNELEPVFIARAQQLADLEGKLSAHVVKILATSRHIRNKTIECEDLWAHRQAMKAFKNGIVSLGAMAVGAVVGGIVAGPAGAMKGAETFMGIANGLQGPLTLEAKNCVKVTALVQEWETEFSQITPTVDQIILVRKDMAKLESGYMSLDKTITETSGPPAPAPKQEEAAKE
jgi:hypothetical protein